MRAPTPVARTKLSLVSTPCEDIVKLLRWIPARSSPMQHALGRNGTVVDLGEILKASHKS